MKIIKKVKDLKKEICAREVMLVPTMGCLHDGHISLVKKAKLLKNKSSNALVIVTIFVNKAQFNDLSDFKKYPITIEEDIKLLKKEVVDIVFIPDNDEIYNSNLLISINLNKNFNKLCAKKRVGHFEGVALIIIKLFNIIKPNIAIFGEKDFQQIYLIKKINEELNYDIKIFTVNTVRNDNGLALSSRNNRLNKNGIKRAEKINVILKDTKKQILNIIGKNSKITLIKIILAKAKEDLKEISDSLEYLELYNDDLIEFSKSDLKNLRIFVAVYIDNIRLIDNLKIN